MRRKYNPFCRRLLVNARTIHEERLDNNTSSLLLRAFTGGSKIIKEILSDCSIDLNWLIRADTERYAKGYGCRKASKMQMNASHKLRSSFYRATSSNSVGAFDDSSSS